MPIKRGYPQAIILEYEMGRIRHSDPGKWPNMARKVVRSTSSHAQRSVEKRLEVLFCGTVEGSFPFPMFMMQTPESESSDGVRAFAEMNVIRAQQLK